jgi:hypothetical protein
VGFEEEEEEEEEDESEFSMKRASLVEKRSKDEGSGRESSPANSAKMKESRRA